MRRRLPPNDSAKLDLKPAAPSITLTGQKQKEEPAVDEVDRDASTKWQQTRLPSSPAPSDVAEGRKLIRTPAQIAGHELQTAVEHLTSLARKNMVLSPLRTRASCSTESSRARSSSRLHPKIWIGFFQQARDLGELKNQTVGTRRRDQETTSIPMPRLRNAKRMEERL